MPYSDSQDAWDSTYAESDESGPGFFCGRRARMLGKPCAHSDACSSSSVEAGAGEEHCRTASSSFFLDHE